MEFQGHPPPLVLLGGEDPAHQLPQLARACAHPQLQIRIGRFDIAQGAPELRSHDIEAPRQRTDLILGSHLDGDGQLAAGHALCG